jgi:hypothetical protein
MGQIIAAPLNGARGRGPGNICAFRLADRDLDRLAELVRREDLLNMSAGIRLALSAGLDELERGEPEPLISG